MELFFLSIYSLGCGACLAGEFHQRFASQLAIFDNHLFPPSDYSMRNAASRKDGYWPFVSRKEEPPLDFTYGEFPLPLFNAAIDRACEVSLQAHKHKGLMHRQNTQKQPARVIANLPFELSVQALYPYLARCAFVHSLLG